MLQAVTDRTDPEEAQELFWDVPQDTNPTTNTSAHKYSLLYQRDFCRTRPYVVSAVQTSSRGDAERWHACRTRSRGSRMAHPPRELLDDRILGADPTSYMPRHTPRHSLPHFRRKQGSDRPLCTRRVGFQAQSPQDINALWRYSRHNFSTPGGAF